MMFELPPLTRRPRKTARNAAIRSSSTDTWVQALEPRVLLASAASVFAPVATYPIQRVPTTAAVGDFANNGLTDIATVIPDQNLIGIQMNNGDGTFAAPTYISSTFPRAIATGDFTGDGNIDLAVTSSSFDVNAFTNNVFGNGIPIPTTGSTLRIYLGNGDGTFSTTPLKFPLRSGGRAIQAADLNGDGLPDIVVTTQFRVAVLLNIGNGGFTAPTYYAVGGGNPRALAIGDFNNDGLPDIAVAGGKDNNVTILLNNPAAPGTFGAPLFYPSGPNPLGITTGDFNHDGNLDLALVTSGFRTSAVSVLLGNGDGSFRPPAFYNGAFFSDAITTADFTNDGNLDLAVASFDSLTTIYPGNGDGTFGPPADIPTTLFGQFLEAADFNNDGLPDLLQLPHNGTKILLNNGTVVAPAAPGASAEQTIGVGASPSFQFTTTDGTTVTVSMSGPGNATLQFSNTAAVLTGNRSAAGTPLQLASITTTGTTAATKLSISTNGGSRTVTFADITTDAPIGSIDAPRANLTGAVSLAGGATLVSLLSANSGSISIGAGQLGSLLLGQTSNEAITSAVPIGTLQVTLDAGGNLTAPSIGKFFVGGSLHDATITLNAPFSTTGFDLGNLSVNRGITNVVLQSAGNIGPIKALSITGSSIEAGVGPLPPGQLLPAAPTDFVSPASIQSVSLQPPKNAPSFVNSVIAASSEGTLNLAGIESPNGGTAFGVAAHSITRLTGTDLASKRSFTLSNLTSAAQVTALLSAQRLNLQDFTIRIL
jgi:hypothetical protein